jgi:hypothetical protein
MNFIYRHIEVVGRFTALLLFTSSLGFTAVRVICCEPDEAGFHLMADTHSGGDKGAAPLDLMIAPPGDGCHINVLGGGINSTPTVFEKESKPNNTRPDELLALVWHDDPHQQSDLTAHKSVLVLSEKPFLPLVEKYVLNASLLI